MVEINFHKMMLLVVANINLRHCGNRQIMNDDEDVEWE